jgi:hypothetical protein
MHIRLQVARPVTTVRARESMCARCATRLSRTTATSTVICASTRAPSRTSANGAAWPSTTAATAANTRSIVTPAAPSLPPLPTFRMLVVKTYKAGWLTLGRIFGCARPFLPSSRCIYIISPLALIWSQDIFLSLLPLAFSCLTLSSSEFSVPRFPPRLGWVQRGYVRVMNVHDRIIDGASQSHNAD